VKETKPEPTREPFDLAEFEGEVSTAARSLDLQAAVKRLTHPSPSSETLHWGRNYLYAEKIETEGEPLEVVVKQFRNQGVRGQLERRLKGSKAARSWRGAWALERAGVPTAEPMLLIESKRPDGPSYFVTRRLHDLHEARYFFRALEAGSERATFPEIDAERVMKTLGRAIRQMHDAGIWHRDLSIGNVLLGPKADDAEGIQVFFIDLNRSRHRRRLTTQQRTRDLCRLRIFRPEHQELFLQSYWGEATQGLERKRALYRLFFQGFLAKVAVKNALRAPLRGLREKLRPRHPHVHIPQAPAGTSSRDRAVWDGLSDQPHQHATRMQRLAVRVADAPLHAREWSTGVAALSRARERYTELKAQLYREPHAWHGMGIAIRPWPANPDALLEALTQLGGQHILLRLHPWQQEHREEEALAAELHARGYELAFVLPQNRELVRDLERWRAAVTELADRFGRFGHHFQIGQAINRSKWGVWNYREYLELVGVASEVLRKQPGRTLLGPGVIDYEPLRTAGILNLPSPGFQFDILASLLYVDRRGAPENRQLGFDTVDKVVQLKAIAETSRNCGDRSWITEVNWPLWEGPHSPAGRKVAVDEETQANYLARYYLLALGTGLVERIYWWQLVARGYGLAHDTGDGTLRLRPSFKAFANLQRNLEGALFLGPVQTPPPGRLYAFRLQDGADLVVGWSADDSNVEIVLPRAARSGLDRDGNVLSPLPSAQVKLDGSPRYLWLESE
jgi:tRNA A-37 threonylcarbamoyl transferase component Bud32